MKDNRLPKLVEDETLEDDTLPFSLWNRQPPGRNVAPAAAPAGGVGAVTIWWDPFGHPPVLSHMTEFPMELQVNILTYLRAYDLAAVHQTCRYYSSPALVHAIVLHAAEGGVYPAELTQGFEQQPVMADASNANDDNNDSKKPSSSSNNKKGPKKKGPTVTAACPVTPSKQYTFEHLRNMELLVVARVLSRPEPFSEDKDNNASGGYFVSKSWCKTALKWLEWQQERQQMHAQLQAANAKKNHNNNKKLSKKQQRLQQRKCSDASPPWPNVNSDIVCCHLQLQRCSNRKSARARRKVLDKQAWKCLKKLYPESVSLETTQGECLQCLLEAETEKKTHQQGEEKRREERKAPLSQPVLRRFYTRTRGVPVHCCSVNNKEKTLGSSSGGANNHEEDNADKDDDTKLPATPRRTMVEDHAATTTTRPSAACPLVPGLYYAVPRAWCHAWRKYMKTGEGGPLLPPDASTLLCDAHRLSLLPPHLEAYLYGESPQLWVSKKQQLEEDMMDDPSSHFASPVARRSRVVGLSPDVLALQDVPSELGFLSPTELALQQRAMITLERQREQQQQQREREAAAINDETNNHGRRASLGEQLDRENYCCVEIMAHDELEALEKLWPRQTVFRLSFQVLDNGDVCFSTQPCRECDASGMANFCKIPKTSKANLRAAHQVKVRTYNHKTSNNNVNGGSKPGVQLEY